MGKIAIWILVIIAVMLVLRLIASNKRKVAADPASDKVGARRAHEKGDGEPNAGGGELMMSCAVCEIHVPASDAVFARGKVFCSAEHRDFDEARRESGRT